MSNRELKKKVLKLLSDDDFEKSLENICHFPAKRVVNPLFSFFYNTDELIRWRAITAMGAVVSRLADQDLESAQVIMRRLMWNLNDESGGIGWGSPEAMGEIMARHSRLAEEFCCILISYIDENCNYIEHEILQRGVLWGLGRLAHARSELVIHAGPFLLPYLQSEDPIHRGLAAWAAGAIDTELAKSLLQNLTSDNTTITVFIDMRLVERQVSQLAMEALLK
jgi:HEAT repeat protein